MTFFTDDEVAEIVQEEVEKLIYVQQLQDEWEAAQLTRKEREIAFDIPEFRRRKMREEYLETQYAKAAVDYYQAKKSNDPNVKYYEGRKNQKRFHYEIFSYTPEKDGTVTPEQIQQAKQHKIREYIKLDSRGFAACPFHKEKSPSFHATDEFFYCFGCHEKGDVIQFIRKMHNYTFREAIKFLL